MKNLSSKKPCAILSGQYQLIWIGKNRPIFGGKLFSVFLTKMIYLCPVYQLSLSAADCLSRLLPEHTWSTRSSMKIWLQQNSAGMLRIWERLSPYLWPVNWGYLFILLIRLLWMNSRQRLAIPDWRECLASVCLMPLT